MTEQLMLAFPVPVAAPCTHEFGFYSHAEVPGGTVCSQCGEWVCRDFVPPDEPDQLGYVSATWAWHYQEGRAWTDDRESN
jgi:hypothetical protein